MQQLIAILSLVLLLAGSLQPAAQQVQLPETNPPAQPVKLIFIHHSTGGNWLADEANNELGGGLGRALMENNYYVSATNYGWGPDSIGDATDIPNWLDWFRGERSSVYTEALYSESGKNIGDFSDWLRLADDPGGENRVIVFKSCFPNSELEGRPDDPPAAEGWLTVSNAKYIYNEILQYFATRPDKLFIVVTAPPLSSSGNAKNARAFNLWLVNDWLNENNYTLNNVAVFDFYNVLTGPDSHHHIVNGQFEHTYTSGQDRLYYPSGDDHPSRAGNNKATEEFVPMLNAFYNRWQATAPDAPPAIEPVQPAEEAATEVQGGAVPAAAGSFTDDFESELAGWQAFTDENGVTQLTCAIDNQGAYAGSGSLQMAFSIAPDGWATCARYFDSAQDWSSFNGLIFALRSAEPGSVMHVDLYAGAPESQESYYHTIEMTAGSDNWAMISIPWQDFKRVDWEENAGTPLSNTNNVLGIAFGYPGTSDPLNSGSLWIDEIRLLGEASPVVPQENQAGAEPPSLDEESPPVETPARERKINFPLCGGAIALPLALVASSFGIKKRHRSDL